MVFSENTDVQHKETSGMAFQERLKSRKDGFDLVFGNDRQDHLQAALVIEHEVPFMEPAVTFARQTAEDGIATGLDPIEYFRHKTQVLAVNNDLDFLHRVKRNVTHGLLILLNLMDY